MTLHELLESQHNDLSDHDLAVLADWAGEEAIISANPDWKRAYALIRQGADTLLRRRARSVAADETNKLSNNLCAVCGGVLVSNRADGCVRGDCSKRPCPSKFYDLTRAALEYAEVGNSIPEVK